MKRLAITFSLFIFFFQHGIIAQIPSEPWLKGFESYVTGSFIGYNNALKSHGSALLVRSQDKSRFIEWKTQALPNKATADHYTFAWLAGYDSVKVPRKYQMFLNGKLYFTFTGKIAQEWKIAGPKGTTLHYVNRIMDMHNDFQGYHFLTVPDGLFKSGEPIQIKVMGESKDEYTWYMVFMDPLETSVNVVNEQALVRKGDELVQQVRIDIIHHGEPKKVSIGLSEENKKEEVLQLGKNIFYFPFEQVKEKKELGLDISIAGQKSITRQVTVKPVRKFEIYFLPHSHVDIGYTHTQQQVEHMQWDHFEKAMELAEKTKDYPEGSRFKWNAEVFWAVDGYLRNVDQQKQQKFMDAVNNGTLYLDGLYGNVLTGIMRPEELFRMAGENVNKLHQDFGIDIETAMITDVAGYSWSLIPALADNGIKYFSSGPNHMTALPHGGDRVGYTLEAWGDKPFYWESPSGKDKILFWMTVHGYSWFHGGNLGEIRKAGSAPILSYLDDLDEEGYPYDMVYLRYTIGGDNGPPDPELPEFIREWNQKYEWPKLRIATTKEMFHDFEKQYSKQLPVLRGDFTPYWEDGAGSSARETALSRNATDKLVQAEVLWSLLRAKQEFPHQDFYKGWRNSILFSEHTWGANISVSNPDSEFTRELWRVKQKMATDADSIANSLLSEVIPNTDSKEITVLNTTSWMHNELVRIPASWQIGNKSITNEHGDPVPTQLLTDGSIAIIADSVPALGAKYYSFSDLPRQEQKSSGMATSEMLSNGIVQVKIDPSNGFLTHFSYVEDGINMLDEQAEYKANAYIYTGIDGTNPQTSNSPEIVVTENGPLVYEWKVKYQAPGVKALTSTIQLYSGSDVVYITNFMDKLDIRKKENVRFAFPFNVDCGEMTMDLAWTTMRPEKDQLPGANKNFFTIQRWVDISSDNRGVTWVTPDAQLVEVGGMFGESWMKDPTRPWIRTHVPSQKIFSWVMNNSWHTNYKASQEGPVTFRYMIDPHKSRLNTEEAKKFGIEMSQPFVVAKGKIEISHEILRPESDSVIITAIRPNEDGKGYQVRLFNTSDTFQKINLEKWNSGNKQLFLSNAREEKLEAISKNLYFGAWEIKTIYVED